jgi:hypothetical protein
MAEATRRAEALFLCGEPVIDLKDAHVGDGGARKIGKLIARSTTIVSLNLARNGISAAGAKGIGFGLRRNSTLRTLSLMGACG